MEMTGMKYNVDLVLCIDATMSMKPVIDNVKESALSFYEDLMKVIGSKQKSINQLRMKIIIFRDYVADGAKKAMRETDFFVLPDESKSFAEAVNSIEVSGGGDEPEDGLEALAYAIRSDWNREGTRNRHVICVWTDASTHELGFGKKAPGYPAVMARDFSELTNWWGDEQLESPYISNRSKRLVLFAPDATYWNTIRDSWNNVVHYPSEAGKGLEEVEYQAILELIAATVS